MRTPPPANSSTWKLTRWSRAPNSGTSMNLTTSRSPGTSQYATLPPLPGSRSTAKIAIAAMEATGSKRSGGHVAPNAKYPLLERQTSEKASPAIIKSKVSSGISSPSSSRNASCTASCGRLVSLAKGFGPDRTHHGGPLPLPISIALFCRSKSPMKSCRGGSAQHRADTDTVGKDNMAVPSSFASAMHVEGACCSLSTRLPPPHPAARHSMMAHRRKSHVTPS
mmetsp:Transcript_38358/g.97132  ORF Transcript_38358/g.97132 Transcript_38358/m.97132 type:complete len:223 (-) Transcript_38358:555-1223(-)